MNAVRFVSSFCSSRISVRAEGVQGTGRGQNMVGWLNPQNASHIAGSCFPMLSRVYIYKLRYNTWIYVAIGWNICKMNIFNYAMLCYAMLWVYMCCASIGMLSAQLMWYRRTCRLGSPCRPIPPSPLQTTQRQNVPHIHTKRILPARSHAKCLWCRNDSMSSVRIVYVRRFSI